MHEPSKPRLMTRRRFVLGPYSYLRDVPGDEPELGGGALGHHARLRTASRRCARGGRGARPDACRAGRANGRPVSARHGGNQNGRQGHYHPRLRYGACPRADLHRATDEPTEGNGKRREVCCPPAFGPDARPHARAACRGRGRSRHAVRSERGEPRVPSHRSGTGGGCLRCRQPSRGLRRRDTYLRDADSRRSRGVFCLGSA